MTAAERHPPTIWTGERSRRDDLLARLQAEPAALAAERRALPTSVQTRLAALLIEIDEIVLPRRLHLMSGPRDVARLTVSHRRLIAVDLPGRTQPVTDTGNLPQLLASRLLEIAEMRCPLALVTRRRTAPPTQAEDACSVATLAEALALATTQNAFDRLLRHMGPASVARLLWSQTRPEGQFSGAPERAALLQAFAQAFRDMGQGHHPRARVGPLRTEGIAIPMAQGQVLILAALDKTGFAAILPRQAGLDAIAAWQVT